MPPQQTAFWIHGDKKRNCSKRSISPFVTMFSTWFNDYTFIYRYFLYYALIGFKVVCSRFVVCGKGLRSRNDSLITMMGFLKQSLKKALCERVNFIPCLIRRLHFSMVTYVEKDEEELYTFVKLYSHILTNTPVPPAGNVAVVSCRDKPRWLDKEE